MAVLRIFAVIEAKKSISVFGNYTRVFLWRNTPILRLSLSLRGTEIFIFIPSWGMETLSVRWKHRLRKEVKL